MSSAVQDVLSVSNYQGDAKAGGSYNIGIDIPSTPFDTLALHTLNQNKDLWTRKNKQDDAAAIEIAKITGIDPANTNKKVYDHLVVKQNDLLKMVENGMPDYQTDPELFLEYNKKKKELENQIAYANASEVKKETVKNKIAAETDPIVKKALQDYLEAAEETWLKDGVEQTLKMGKLIQTELDPKKQDWKIPQVSSKIKLITVKYLDNNNEEIESEFDNEFDRKSISIQLAYGEDNKEFEGDINDPDYKQKKSDFNLIKATGGKSIATKATVDNFNKIKDVYKQQLAVYNALPEDQKATQKPPQEPDFLQQAEAINVSIREKNAMLKRQSETNPGVIYKSFEEINLLDGIEPWELIYMKSYTEDTDNSILYKKTAKETGAGTAERTRLDNKADNKAKIGLAYANLSLEKQKLALDAAKGNLKSNGRGGYETTINIDGKDVPVTDYAEFRKNELKNMVTQTGIPFSQLDADQQKYISLISANNKTTRIRNFNNAIIKKTKDGFEVEESNGDAKKPAIIGKIYLTETTYKNAVNTDVSTITAGKDNNSFKASQTQGVDNQTQDYYNLNELPIGTKFTDANGKPYKSGTPYFEGKPVK
jgi:hypothetical protein